VVKSADFRRYFENARNLYRLVHLNILVQLQQQVAPEHRFGRGNTELEFAMRRVVTKPSDRPAMAHWSPPPPYIMNVELRRSSTEDKLFEDWDVTGPGEGRLAADEEAFQFKRLHFCAFHLAQLYKKAHKSAKAAPQYREYSKWMRRYDAVRQRLVEANLGLVYDLIGRSRFGALDRDEMCSEGMMALLRAVDTFDPWRGFRFSTYACNAILRAFSRAALKDSKRRSLMSAPYDPSFEKSDEEERRHVEDGDLYAERLRLVMDNNDADLTRIERNVLARRFPEDDDGSRETLDDIGKDMNVSKERVRQIQLSAIAKLREVLEADAILQ
jgi:RNA polymerase sigma factor (sigma-70 family)